MNYYFDKLLSEETVRQRKLLQGNFEHAGEWVFLSQKFVERDEVLFNYIFPAIESYLADPDAIRHISSLRLAELAQEKEMVQVELLAAARANITNPMAMLKLRCIEQAIQDTRPATVLAVLQSNAREVWESVGEPRLTEEHSKRYLHHSVARLLYDDYKLRQSRDTRFLVPADNALKALYLKNGIDLEAVDVQFSKYKLLSVDENFEISKNNVRIHDNRIDATVLIREISGTMFNLLRQLKEDGLIRNLALRPDYEMVGKFADFMVALEEFERGKPFKFEGLASPNVSKLYSIDDYGSSLWVHIDGENITFEELLSGFEVYDDCIVTQVLHLEYFSEGGQYYIKHIDHEFIFYTLEEFEVRQKSHRQKGTGQTRYKTFKVDQSRIPFALPDGRFLLYIVLDQYFEKDELLKEYFASVI